MFKKKNSYELDVRGITFWRKKISENNTEVFVKDSLNEPFILYIDKVKDDNYYDLVTGRLFDMEDIPVNFVYEEIRETKKIYNDKNNTKCKTLKKK